MATDFLPPGWRDYDPEVTAARAAAGAWLAAYRAGEPPRWLSLLGVSGVGKTTLALALAAAVRRQPMQTVWTWAAVGKLLTAGSWDVLEQLAKQPVLVLDDFTQPYRPPLTAWDGRTLQKLGELFDRRVGKWTVLTDNRLRSQIADLDARLASRMKRGGGVIVSIKNAPDYSDL